MTSLNISNNNLGQLVLPKGWRVNQVQVLPKGFRNVYYGPNGEASWDAPAGSKPKGAITLVSAISRLKARGGYRPCQCHPLTSLHVGKNNIPEKEMREIMAIAMHMKSMKILCGVPFKDKTLTELDVSGKNLGTEGALVVAEYLDGNGALLVLNLASNWLGSEGAIYIADALQNNTALTSLNISSNYLAKSRPLIMRGVVDMSGVTALANAISDMRAMKSLDLSGNQLGAKGAKHITDGIKVGKCVVAVGLAPFSCPSDHWLINCCCLLLSPEFEGIGQHQY
jgi:Ran GTPase-activating protein (RanGAP) involved in mRNA processing and transport